MTEHLDKIKKAVEPLRQQIINHKVYSVIDDLDDLKIFMQHHVYAVWDFMSLLKSLQNNLTCTSVPWFPKGTPDTRYLINEIVVGEESDLDSAGGRKSHFELYLEAMGQCGTDTSQIDKFIEVLKKTGDLNLAFTSADTPQNARAFVDFTFKIIGSNKDYLQSAIFTFGREDLIPAMFLSIVNDMHKKFPGNISIFKYYLDRHIVVDGDHHSHLALKMTSNLCDKNEQFWKEAEQASIESLQKRIDLWDGVYNEIKLRKTSVKNKLKSIVMKENESLFERIGGSNAVDAAVDIFYAKVLADEKVSRFFTNTDMKTQRGKMKIFLSYAFGAPLAYTGKNMRDAHAHANIKGEHFNAVAGHLVATLQELKVAQNLIDEVVAIALSVKDDVLTH